MRRAARACRESWSCPVASRQPRTLLAEAEVDGEACHGEQPEFSRTRTKSRRSGCPGGRPRWSSKARENGHSVTSRRSACHAQNRWPAAPSTSSACDVSELCGVHLRQMARWFSIRVSRADNGRIDLVLASCAFTCRIGGLATRVGLRQGWSRVLLEHWQEICRPHRMEKLLVKALSIVMGSARRRLSVADCRGPGCHSRSGRGGIAGLVSLAGRRQGEA